MSCPFRLQLITSEEASDDNLVERARIVLSQVPSGSVSIHVRRRTHEQREVTRLVERMASVCANKGAFLVVNRLVDVAVEFDAGLHAGKPSRGSEDVIDRARSAQLAWISTSAHTDDEVRIARALGVSAAMVSPIFATRSGAHLSGSGDPSLKVPRGLSAVASAVEISGDDLPCVALGGIDRERARDCFEQGARAVATMSQWLEVPIGKFIDEWTPLLLQV